MACSTCFKGLLLGQRLSPLQSEGPDSKWNPLR